MKKNAWLIGLALCVVMADRQSVCGKEPPASAQQLLASVETAFKTKDKAALTALVNWQGVSESMRSMHADGLAAMVTREIKSVKLLPLPAEFKSEFELNGVRYHPNVAIAGIIEVQHAQAGNATQIPYGKNGNAFYLAGTVEERFAAPAKKEKAINVMVMGTTAPDPVVFEGYCLYLKGGKEMREEISGKGNRSKGFWGDHVTHCEVRKKSGSGWISLVISEDQQPVFNSPQETTDKPIIYDAKF